MKRITLLILLLFFPGSSFTQTKINTTNKKIISEEEIYESPEARIDEIVGYSSGTTYINDDSYSGKGYVIRGGAIYETDMQIDGISLMNELTHIPEIPLNRSHIKEIQIQTGGFNAEYGNLRSGLINIILKDGSFNKYSGTFEARISPSSKKHYGISPYSTETAHWEVLAGSDAMKGIPSNLIYNQYFNPEGKYPYGWIGWEEYSKYRGASAEHCFELWKWNHRSIPYADEPDFMIDAGYGGPIPIFKNSKFYFSQFYNKSLYLFPRSRKSSNEFSTILKITKNINTNINIIFTGFFNYIAGISPGGRIFSGLSPSIITGDDKLMSANTFSYRTIYQEAAFNPCFSRYYAANLKVIKKQSKNITLEGSINITKYNFGRNPMRSTDEKPIKFIYDETLGKEFGYDEYPRGYPGTKRPRFDQTNLFLFSRSPGGRGRQNNDYTILNLKNRITYNFKKSHYITAGMEINIFNLNERTEWNSSNPTDPIEKRPYTWLKYNVTPKEYNLIFQDKAEISNTTAFLGLRINYYNPDSKGFDLSDNNLFSQNYMGFAEWGKKEGEGNWGSAKMRTRNIKNKIRIMPRLGIARIFRDEWKLFFNFGHYYTRPDPRIMFAVLPTKYLGWAQTSATIPQPDIRWPKTISYEFGLNYKIKNEVIFQISIYNKDITYQITQLDINGYYGTLAMKTYNNSNFADISGMELSLIRDFGRFINFHANYNYMRLISGYNGIKEINQNPAIGVVSHSEEEFKPKPLPYFNLYINIKTPPNWGPGKEIFGIKPLSEWSTSILFRIQDSGNFLVNPDVPQDKRIYVNIVDRRMLNFYIRKRFTKKITFYLQIINPLNWKQLNPNGISNFEYYYYSLHLPWEEGSQKGNDKIGSWDKEYIYTGFYDWVKFYPDKRDIYFGIRYQF